MGFNLGFKGLMKLLYVHAVSLRTVPTGISTPLHTACQPAILWLCCILHTSWHKLACLLLRSLCIVRTACQYSSVQRCALHIMIRGGPITAMIGCELGDPGSDTGKTRHLLIHGSHIYASAGLRWRKREAVHSHVCEFMELCLHLALYGMCLLYTHSPWQSVRLLTKF